MKKCGDCYYSEHDGDKYPCVACDTLGDKWVAKSGGVFFSEPVNVFKNIDNHGEAMVERQHSPQVHEEEVVTRRFSVEGVKYDNDKPKWSLLPFKALKEVVDVLTYGAKKYAPDNWKKVPNAKQRYIDAGFRHFTAYAAGEKLDPETGKSHLAHAICCLLYLLAFEIGEDRG
jgi:hypothetical protein